VDQLLRVDAHSRRREERRRRAGDGGTGETPDRVFSPNPEDQRREVFRNLSLTLAEAGWTPGPGRGRSADSGRVPG
jgi:hypothetical protein